MIYSLVSAPVREVVVASNCAGDLAAKQIAGLVLYKDAVAAALVLVVGAKANGIDDVATVKDGTRLFICMY